MFALAACARNVQRPDGAVPLSATSRRPLAVIVKSARPFASVVRVDGLTAIEVDAGAPASFAQSAATERLLSTVGQTSCTCRALLPSAVIVVAGLKDGWISLVVSLAAAGLAALHYRFVLKPRDAWAPRGPEVDAP